MSSQNQTYSRVVGIQFGIMSPDEIRKGSVAEITSKEVAFENHKPVFGGLFDPRMGVLEQGMICPTDGLDYMRTPGYHGHIEMARPVIYYQYITSILKVLKCVCFKCSKLLISKKKHKELLSMSNELRWKQVCKLCEKAKRCGNQNEHGCGTLQPSKIYKSELATIYCEWESKSVSADENKITESIQLSCEVILKIFSRISNDDITFMGFSPVFSRPEWMICQVLYVCPPAVRPSVKQDSQQRSEDDLTQILMSILKTNKILQDKLDAKAVSESNGLDLTADKAAIETWTAVLQYYVTVMIDNKIPGFPSMTQRSGRPLKAIKDRLNGKNGRMRFNLMAKRVNYSARSVITADPNISVVELGVPMKIAMNLTKPVTVNAMNRSFLTKLVLNGHTVWPGAKTVQKKGETRPIELRNMIDRASLRLENGDVVHRHMMDGDAILFNRQPTLHRMSMMCHIARVMKHGDTFRMNVADTKPYNADFDGDEMNLHMPQDVEPEAELKYLAAVIYQIISPANNSPIIGIYQDSMLGSYQFTRENIRFGPREAMNLLMRFDHVNEHALMEQFKGESNQSVSSFQILSQIMPPMSIHSKTSAYKDTEDMQTSNHVIDINNGRYLRGQMDKGVLGGGSKGLLHRICNDFGNAASAKFIDDLQNIVTEYMNTSSFSVGISDLLSDQKTKDEIMRVIIKKKNEVKNLIDQIQIGIFENNTGKSNDVEFETKVNNILNQATSETGKIGLNSLSKNNRFVIQVLAGSKGSDLNITQMISCLGQQNVDGKRIPYGLEGRTLPHYTKYDDSPGARGFVESSYVDGLTPQELYFHAMGGRVGLIDTAIKTSQTGYIQRRLVKALEDIQVMYDMTVRTSKNRIVQFSYGDDNIDTTKVENQVLRLVKMSTQDIYNHYLIAQDTGIIRSIFTQHALSKYTKELDEYARRVQPLINYMIEMRTKIMTHVFANTENIVVHCPVAFDYLIDTIQGQCNISIQSLVDFTLMDAMVMLDETYARLVAIHYAPPTELFKVLFYFALSPKTMLIVKRFNRAAFTLMMETVVINYMRAIVAPGEMVGMIAGQSIGEVSTQMTLNTFHFAGVSSKSNVTRGVQRLEELMSLSTDIKNPSLTVFLKPEDEHDKSKALSVMNMLEYTCMSEIVQTIEICFDPSDENTNIQKDQATIKQYLQFQQMVSDCASSEAAEINADQLSKWIVRIVMDPEVMFDKNITMDDVNYTLSMCFKNEIQCVFSDYNSDQLVFRIRLITPAAKKTKKKMGGMSGLTSSVEDGGEDVFPISLDQSDQIHKLKTFQERILSNVVLRGVSGLKKVNLRKIVDNVAEVDGVYKKKEIWVLDTVGSNLMGVLGLDYIDATRTISNSIMEIYHVLGIEAARQALYNEYVEVVGGTYINSHNFSMLVDRMSYSHKLVSIFRHGLNNDDTGPIAKASFEETPEMFLKAARHSELDIMRGVSANVMCGQEGFYGTSSFQTILDIELLSKLEAVSEYKPVDVEAEIEEMLRSENAGDACSIQQLTIQNNVATIRTVDMGAVDDNYDAGF
jgi:DNA-directed RNA polymerase II subunit RPB1